MQQIKNSILNTYSQHLNREAGQLKEFTKISEQTGLRALKTTASEM